MTSLKSIPVRDANGDQLTVYEYYEWRFLQKVRRFKLDSGESVQALNDGTFVLPSGEKLIRLDA